MHNHRHSEKPPDPCGRAAIKGYKGTLQTGKSYQIIITSSGTVQSSYCKLAANGREYYTEQISTAEPDNTISFTFTFDESMTVDFFTRWGTYHVDNAARELYNGKEYRNLTETPSA